MTRMTGTDCAVMCNLINTHTHTYEWHIMTRMAGGPDCAVMCNLINTHTQTHTFSCILISNNSKLADFTQQNVEERKCTTLDAGLGDANRREKNFSTCIKILFKNSSWKAVASTLCVVVIVVQYSSSI